VTGRGVVAAGHPESAAAGAAVLRAGGNAVDAAVAAVLTSFVSEPLLTGLGSGGYLLVVPPGGEAVLLDFFVETPGRGRDLSDRAPLRAVTVDFGDATQVFHAGAASCGTYGTPAGLAAAVAGFGRAPLAELTAPAVRLARAGVRVTPMQVAMVSAGIANGGVVMRPYLINQVLSADLQTIDRTSPERLGTAVSSQTAATLTQMLTAVVDQGTGTPAKINGVQVAGKTGTAEQGNGKPPHAWFTAFAPANDPKVAVAVVVEDGGNAGNEAAGGRLAGPIAKAVMEAVLNQ